MLCNLRPHRALHRAVKTPTTTVREIDALAAAAESAGELDAVNVRYQTALHLAAVVDRDDVARLLVSRGASPCAREQLHGDTVLHLACRLGRSRCLVAVCEALQSRAKQTAATTDRCYIPQTLKDILHSINYEGIQTSSVFTCIGALGTPPSRTGPIARKYSPGFPYS